MMTIDEVGNKGCKFINHHHHARTAIDAKSKSYRAPKCVRAHLMNPININVVRTIKRYPVKMPLDPVKIQNAPFKFFF